MTAPSLGLHPSALDPQVLAAQCDLRFTRRGGPGGQNRNKVETAVVLHHRPTGLGAEASERRSQHQNLQAALFRLRLNLALLVRTEVATDAPPSPLWQARCRGGRLRLSPDHDDFPALLAEALDRLDAHAQDLKAAAEALGCSATQLVNLFKGEPRAMILVNRARIAAGQRALH